MPAQIIPIQDVASAGVIKDTPSITLPPNVYSDVSNVRFHAGAVRKMEGEEEIVVSLSVNPDDDTDFTAYGSLVYVAYWQAPSTSYYIVIDEPAGGASTANVYVHEITSSGVERVGVAVGTFPSQDGTWQHTLFNGGFNLVLNNGLDKPMYLSDPASLNSMTELPNWDSYLSQEDVTTVTWDEFNFDIYLGRPVNFTTQDILYTVIPRDTTVGVLNEIQTAANQSGLSFTLDTSEDADNPFITPMQRDGDDPGALPGDTIMISIRTKAAVQVRAGVIRSYGNLLVAGDLTEMDIDDASMIVRRLPGTIRTSDVAAPGQIPLNWNPFRNGANTADEFVLSSTGVVQDMAELQGVMYVYTDVSIHAIQQTGNQVIPFQISTTTDSYGANSLGSVMEFDGRHLVVGSQDVYVFSGHPGSISSIADGRVRHYIYERPIADFDATDVRMVRNQKYDEIWIFTPGKTEMFVWNYRNQSWTIRSQSMVVNGSQGIANPLFCNIQKVFIGDEGYTRIEGNGVYESFVERRRLPLTPEFTTETIGATALWYSSSAATQPSLTVEMTGTNKPAMEGEALDRPFEFKPLDDYKVDTRIQGRFMNYRVTDKSATQPWNLTGYQFEVMQGGKR